MPSPVVVLEFNELTPRLMDQFIAQGWLPHFRRFRQESHVFVTDARESQENLEPWIQWVTVHTGLSFEEHGLFHLDEADKLREPSLWDIASDAGKTVWICGSMNVRYRTPLHGWILPDPWSSGEAYPAELNSFLRFVRTMVQEHANEHAPLSKADAVRFLAFLATHGLTAATVSAVLKQLLAERRGDHGWKRAALLDRMQWDLFRFYFRKARPALSTFFLNSTAHYQHRFWRNLEPERFHIRPADTELEARGDAIPFGYRQMDRIVGEALELIDENTVLMLATGLSQQPYLKMDEEGGKLLYRPHDFNAFSAMFGLTGATKAVPVMAEQFYVYHDSEAAAARSKEILESARCAGEPVFGVIDRQGERLFLGCGIFHALPDDAAIDIGGRQLPFFDAFFLIKESLKSGMHHPDGMLWIRTPERAHHEAGGKLPLTAVAPTILKLLDLPIPPYMRTAPVSFSEPVAAVQA